MEQSDAQLDEGTEVQAETAQEEPAKFEFREEWIDQNVPEEYRDLAKQYKDPVALVKALADTQKLAQDRKIALSRRRENFTDSDWKLFFEADERINNVPANPADYKYNFKPDREMFRDNNYINGEWVNVLQNVCHELRLDTPRAQILMDRFNEFNSFMDRVRAEQAEVNHDNVIRMFQEEFQSDFDRKSACAKNGTRVMGEEIGRGGDYGEQRVNSMLRELSPENAVFLLRHLINLGERVTESARPGYYGVGETKSSAINRLHEYMSDPTIQGIMGNPLHPDFVKTSKTLDMLRHKAGRM